VLPPGVEHFQACFVPKHVKLEELCDRESDLYILLRKSAQTRGYGIPTPPHQVSPDSWNTIS
jgi:hypothetical protein